MAAALTVVVAAAFAVDLAAFLFPNPGPVTRVAVVSGVTLLSVAALVATVLSARDRSRRERRRAGGGEPGRGAVDGPPRQLPRTSPPAPPEGRRAAGDPPRLELR